MALTTLLQHCAAGDADALRQLYELQAARLHGIALRITRQPAMAADVVHDAFVSVWQFASTFDPSRGSPEAWLTSIIRHRALDTMRRYRREIVTGLGGEAEQVGTDPDPLARLQHSSEAAALHRCLQELDAERRRLIAMAFLDGLTHNQLAHTLAIPLGTIKSSIRRGLAVLRRCLES
jgi:RNA polymerase sigma-70 factor (ECF subfamily)